jgi:hypothetical protein
MFSWVFQLLRFITVGIYHFMIYVFDLLWDMVYPKLEQYLDPLFAMIVDAIGAIADFGQHFANAQSIYPLAQCVAMLTALIALYVILIVWRIVWRFLPTMSW